MDVIGGKLSSGPSPYINGTFSNSILLIPTGTATRGVESLLNSFARSANSKISALSPF